MDLANNQFNGRLWLNQKLINTLLTSGGGSMQTLSIRLKIIRMKLLDLLNINWPGWRGKKRCKLRFCVQLSIYIFWVNFYEFMHTCLYMSCTFLIWLFPFHECVLSGWPVFALRILVIIEIKFVIVINNLIITTKLHQQLVEGFGVWLGRGWQHSLLFCN